MPAITAERRCPETIFIAADFVRYKKALKFIRSILKRHTDLIQPRP
nr:hypothetical protein [Granulicella sibirica]